MAIRILIADDHSVVRQGLRMFLGLDPDLEVIGEARDGAEALRMARELKPELDGYRAFCEYRDNETRLRGKTKVSRVDWLAAKRRQIWLRIKRRQQDGILRFSY